MRPFTEFTTEFTENIAPIYEGHRATFDPGGIHGVRHISRVIIIAEALCNYYNAHYKDKHDDMNHRWAYPATHVIRYAAAFHDSARKGNGPDLWDRFSALKCFEYLSTREPEMFSEYAKLLINTKDDVNPNFSATILHDADCLEIMRPCCGHGGISGFDKKHLFFMSGRNGMVLNEAVQDQIIGECWRFISETEANKDLYDNVNCLSLMADYVKTQNFAILSNI
jgi:hypothetical protein